jgi:hypothetical protein
MPGVARAARTGLGWDEDRIEAELDAFASYMTRFLPRAAVPVS